MDDIASYSWSARVIQAASGNIAVATSEKVNLGYGIVEQIAPFFADERWYTDLRATVTVEGYDGRIVKPEDGERRQLLHEPNLDMCGWKPLRQAFEVVTGLLEVSLRVRFAIPDSRPCTGKYDLIRGIGKNDRQTRPVPLQQGLKVYELIASPTTASHEEKVHVTHPIE